MASFRKSLRIVFLALVALFGALLLHGCVGGKEKEEKDKEKDGVHARVEAEKKKGKKGKGKHQPVAPDGTPITQETGPDAEESEMNEDLTGKNPYPCSKVDGSEEDQDKECHDRYGQPGADKDSLTAGSKYQCAKSTGNSDEPGECKPVAAQIQKHRMLSTEEMEKQIADTQKRFKDPEERTKEELKTASISSDLGQRMKVDDSGLNDVAGTFTKQTKTAIGGAH